MSDVELTDEERALLELDSKASKVDEPRTQAGKTRTETSAVRTKAEAPAKKRTRTIEDEPSIIPAPSPMVAEPDRLELTRPLDVAGRNPDHPLAPPAQHDYGDPWGQLPVQMRPDFEL